MEMLITVALLLILGFLVVFDVAAIRLGQNSSQSDWTNHGYDPRYNWVSPAEFPFDGKEK